MKGPGVLGCERFCLTSIESVGSDLPEASSSPRLLPDCEPYNPAPDLYYPHTVGQKWPERKEKYEQKNTFNMFGTFSETF